MKLTPKEKSSIKIGVRIAAFTLIFAFLLYNVPILWKGVTTLLSVIKPFLVGLGIAFVVNMPMRRIENILQRLGIKSGLSRILALLLAYIVIFAFLIFTFQIIIPRVVDSIGVFIRRVPGVLTNLRTFIKNATWMGNYQVMVTDFIDKLIMNVNTMTPQQFIDTYFQQIDLQKLLQELASNMFTQVGSIVSVLFSGLVSFIFSIYALTGKENLSRTMKKLLYTFLPEPQADAVMYLSHTTFDNFYNFFTGQFLEAVLLALMNYAGMTILGFRFALVVSLLTLIGALIPLVGAFLAGIVGALMLLTISPTAAVSYIVYVAVLQQLEGNIVYPRVVGSQTGLPGMLVLLAVLVGASTFGFLGMLFFVPITATVYTVTIDYMDRRLAEKNLKVQ